MPWKKWCLGCWSLNLGLPSNNRHAQTTVNAMILDSFIRLTAQGFLNVLTKMNLSRTLLASATGSVGAAASVAYTQQKTAWHVASIKPRRRRYKPATPVLIVFSKKVELFVCNGSLLRLHYGCTTTAKLSSLSSLETWKLLLFRKFSKIRSGSFCIWMPPRLESPSWFQSWPSNTGSEKMANHMSHDT